LKTIKFRMKHTLRDPALSSLIAILFCCVLAACGHVVLSR
jgi:hypothetical protein